jgi:hypothetical protein
MALLDTNPLAQLLGQEQYGQAKNEAMNMGALNAIAQLLALSGPQARPVGTGQAIGQALLGGYSGYQGAMDKTLGDMLKASQVSEMIRKQDEAKQIKQVLASAAKPVYEQTPASPTYEGEDYAMGGQKLVGMTYDMKSVIPTLQALGRFDLIKDIGESQKSLRQSGVLGDANAPSPFAPYINATNPAVRQLATQLEAGFKKGVIDEETAYKRIEPLAKMEESYVAKSEKAVEGKKPTEGERNAAGFAQRMEFSEQKINEIVGKLAKKELAGEKVDSPYATSGTQFAGSIPFIGDWARNKVSSSDQQLYRQAQENWVRANLRKESGAAIGKDEMDSEIKTYFPQPNDDAATRAQKAVARQVTMDSMKKAAGNAYEPFNMSKFMQDYGLEGRK